MVFKRNFLLNIAYYFAICCFSYLNYYFQNNYTILLAFFIPLLFLVFRSLQINATRHSKKIKVILNYFTYIIKFITIFVGISLHETIGITLSMIVIIMIMIVTSIIEYYILYGLNDLPNHVGYIKKKMKTDKEQLDSIEINEQNIVKNDFNSAYFKVLMFYSFVVGAIFIVDFGNNDFYRIFISIVGIIFISFLYRSINYNMKYIQSKIIEYSKKTINILTKRHITNKILIHIGYVSAVIVRIIQGPNTITLLVFIPIGFIVPILSNYRKFNISLMDDDEKKDLGLD